MYLWQADVQFVLPLWWSPTATESRAVSFNKIEAETYEEAVAAARNLVRLDYPNADQISVWPCQPVGLVKEE